MVYGLDVNLDLEENKRIEYKNYVPSRDGFIIIVDNVNIRNQLFAIKLILNYEDTEEKEQILKMVFN
ncbi:MAG: hypothetical protein FGM30_05655 [Candidatus Fonsibacter sp.]|nr:hypothetical protein [Candidatus Fonsibacter sp.]